MANLTPAQREIAMGKGKALYTKANELYPRTFVDKTCGKFFPSTQAKRDLAKMDNTIMAGGYDVTKISRTNRRRGNRMADGSADNAQDDRTLWELREWCRDHDRNSAIMHGIIERAVDNVTGPEYNFMPDTGDKDFDKEAQKLLNDFTANCDCRGLFDFQDYIRLTERSLWTDGDLFINCLNDGKIQAIEAHEPVTPLNGKGRNGRRVIGGVELDKKGMHAAYYVQSPDHNSPYGQSGWIDSHEKAQRLDASNVIHVADRTRFSQTRGVPIVAPCMDAFNHFDGYLDAEMIAAEMDAMRVWAIKRPKAKTAMEGTLTNPNYNTSGSGEDLYEKFMQATPGQVFDLEADEDIESKGGNRPGDNFEPYIVTMIRVLGASVGFPLELVLLDFSRTNYSSARAALLQAYRVFRRRQAFLRRKLIQPIYNFQMSRWIASGQLKPIDNAYRLKFLPPQWTWIDPLKSMLAMEKKIAAGAGTVTKWIEEEGELPEMIWKARQTELAKFDELGIPVTNAPDNLGAKKNEK